MTVTLHNVNRSGLFDLQGRCFYMQGLLDTARNSTLPGEASNIVGAWNNLAFNQATVNLPSSILSALTAWQTAGNSLFSGLQTTVQQLLIQLFLLDQSIASGTLSNALQELVAQMMADSQTVKACNVTVTATPGAANVGNGVMIVSRKRGDGRVQETSYAETIPFVAGNSGASARFAANGQASATPSSGAWPAGSGSRASLSTIQPANSLLTNGGFETNTAVSTLPDGWILSVGTPGTQASLTAIEVQTLTISGTPTSGVYYLSFTNPSGIEQTTGPIPFGASAATVQAALQALSGLGSVTVTGSGTSPNFTFTVTFNGIGGGPLNLLVVTNETTGGSFGVTRTTAGSGLVYVGSRALVFNSDGSTLTTLNQPLTNLLPDTVYGISLWINESGGPSAGAVTVDLANGIGGSTINDDQGNPNSVGFAVNTLTGSWQHLTALATSGDTHCVFRTPANLPSVVYLRIRLSTAVTNGCKLYFDQCSLAALTPLYAGGPAAAIFGGSVNFAANDSFNLAITNDYGGQLQTAYSRFCGTGAAGILLPSSASPSIPDSVIAA
jgi:hypothetical protein